MSASLDVGLLGRVSLFKDLAPEALRSVAGAARLTRCAAGRPFFREGEPAAAFFVLTRGRVKLVQDTADGQEVILRVIGPGDAFGAAAAFATGETYPATAAPLERSEAAAWDGAVMARLMTAHPGIAINALRMVAGRLHELQRQHRELMTERVERRIARALVRLARHGGRRVDGGVEIDFPLSRQDLAEMTGTTLFTVSRTLSAWQAHGLVGVGRRRVTIRPPHRLVAIAEDLRPEPRHVGEQGREVHRVGGGGLGKRLKRDIGQPTHAMPRATKADAAPGRAASKSATTVVGPRGGIVVSLTRRSPLAARRGRRRRRRLSYDSATEIAARCSPSA